MRFLAIFAAVVAVATAYNVVQTTGQAVSEWTLSDLSAALENPATDPSLKPYLTEALNNLMAAMFAGSTQTSIAVVLPPMDVSTWTLQELDQALMDPSLDATLKPYLEHALNQYMEALFAGQHMEVINVFTPAGLIPLPAVPEPSPALVPSPVIVPTPVDTESAPASSPLVQIIVNVNAQQQTVEVPLPVADAVLPSPAVVPEAIVDLPESVVVPAPVIVAPQPVQVAEPIVPEPVQVLFNNEEYICRPCWQRAERALVRLEDFQVDEPAAAEPLLVDEPEPVAEPEPMALPNPDLVEEPEPERVQEPEPVEEPEPEPLQEPEPFEEPEPVQEPLPDNEPEQAEPGQLHVPEYSRPPNTANACIFYGCRNRSRHRIPDTLKTTFLIHFNYYVPPSARVCQEHLDSNDWDQLFEAPNISHYINRPQFLDIMRIMKTAALVSQMDFENLETIEPSLFRFRVGMTHAQFNQLLLETPSLSRNCRKPKQVLGMYLMKLRTGDPNERLAPLFNVSRRSLERKMSIARECLNNEFVPQQLGFDHISRQQIMERNLTVPNGIHGSTKAIIICDGTYIYVQKSSNFFFQRKSYSHHKYRNLLKPFLLVSCDANRFLNIINERINIPNILAEYVIDNNINRQRAAFRSITVNTENVRFPRLTEEDLILFALGTYQIKLAYSYYSEHVRRGLYDIEVHQQLNVNGLQEYGIAEEHISLLRARIQSRHTRSRVYYTYVIHSTNEEQQGRESILHYYCSCVSGKRTLGSCAHVISVIWYLGWARYQDAIRMPAEFLDTIIVNEL